MILHTCETASGFFLTHTWKEKKWYYTFVTLQVIFQFTWVKKKMILRICESTSDFFNSHKRKREMIFHTYGITNVLKTSHMWKKIILHTCEFTSKSLLRNRKQNQIVIKNPIWFWFKSQLGTHEFDFGFKIFVEQGISSHPNSKSSMKPFNSNSTLFPKVNIRSK